MTNFWARPKPQLVAGENCQIALACLTAVCSDSCLYSRERSNANLHLCCGGGFGGDCISVCHGGHAGGSGAAPSHPVATKASPAFASLPATNPHPPTPPPPPSYAP